MVSGYKNVNETVNKILNDFFGEGVNRGDKPGLFNMLTSNQNKLIVGNFHVNSFLGGEYNADIVTPVLVAYQNNNIELQFYMNVTILNQRNMISLIISVANNDSYVIFVSFFLPVSD